MRYRQTLENNEEDDEDNENDVDSEKEKSAASTYSTKRRNLIIMCTVVKRVYICQQCVIQVCCMDSFFSQLPRCKSQNPCKLRSYMHLHLWMHLPLPLCKHNYWMNPKRWNWSSCASSRFIHRSWWRRTAAKSWP